MCRGSGHHFWSRRFVTILPGNFAYTYYVTLTLTPTTQGYRYLPTFSRLEYLRPFEQSAADLSHNIANFMKVPCESNGFNECLFTPYVLTQEVFVLTRPDKSLPHKWRMEASRSGFHTHISTPVSQYLDPAVAAELQDVDIDDMRLVDLQTLARIVGVSASGRKEDLKLRLTPLIQSINGLIFPLTKPNPNHTPTHTCTHTFTHTHPHRYWDSSH